MIGNDSSVEFDCRGVDPEPWMAAAADYCARVLARLGRGPWEVSLVFCDDSFIQDLNLRYAGLDEPTDVLAFSQTEGGSFLTPDGAPTLIGDIVVSIPALRRNVDACSVPAGEELRRLLIHAILHLSGMDHEGDADRKEMSDLQELLIHELPEEILS